MGSEQLGRFGLSCFFILLWKEKEKSVMIEGQFFLLGKRGNGQNSLVK